MTILATVPPLAAEEFTPYICLSTQPMQLGHSHTYAVTSNRQKGREVAKVTRGIWTFWVFGITVL